MPKLFFYFTFYYNVFIYLISSLLVILVNSRPSLFHQFSNSVVGLLEVLLILRVVFLCGELMNESCLPLFWSRDIHSHIHLQRVSMAAILNRVHAFWRSWNGTRRARVSRGMYFWLYLVVAGLSRLWARTHRVAFLKNNAVTKIAWHERLSREIRQSLLPRADLLLLLHSCNGLVSSTVRTRDQQVNRVSLVSLLLYRVVLTSAGRST